MQNELRYMLVQEDQCKLNTFYAREMHHQSLSVFTWLLIQMFKYIFIHHISGSFFHKPAETLHMQIHKPVDPIHTSPIQQRNAPFIAHTISWIIHSRLQTIRQHHSQFHQDTKLSSSLAEPELVFNFILIIIFYANKPTKRKA